ncbi:MAG TPA: hypothetical protein VGN95_18400 [Pyrinomonadaceae bacterium]|nr:hypothetical protein [Pyrinomonadaceae bacterium]
MLLDVRGLLCDLMAYRLLHGAGVYTRTRERQDPHITRERVCDIVIY